MLWLFVSAKLLDTWLHNDLFSFLTSLEYKYQKCLNEMYSIFAQFFFKSKLKIFNRNTKPLTMHVISPLVIICVQG